MTTNCQYWVASKQRYCKFEAVSSGYCQIHDSGSGDKTRIPCPIDPRHSIYEKDIESHSRKCSKVVQNRFEENQPCRRQFCNTAHGSAPSDVPANLACDFPDSVESWFEFLTEIREKLLSFLGEFTTVISDESEACTGSTVDLLVPEVDKHNFQNAALLALMSKFGRDPTLFVELGCGKAGLTRWLIQTMRSSANMYVVLDYEARRNKQENRKDCDIDPDSILRLRLNITDFDMSQFLYPSVKFHKPLNGFKTEQIMKVDTFEWRIAELHAKIARVQQRPDWPLPNAVGVAKHLCGPATDYGLRCLASHASGLVFATCCHHKCIWSELVGKPILEQTGLTESHFAQMKAMAGWATTKSVPEEKRLVGRLVKSVIDLSRIWWIAKNAKFPIALEYQKYIKDEITPENFAIVVRPKQ